MFKDKEENFYDDREVEREINAHGYSLGKKIGRGTASMVFKLFKEGKCFACKLSPKTEMSEREKFFLRLVDSNIFLKLYEAWECRGKSYIVTEFAEGDNLERYIRKNGFLTQSETIDAALRIAEGLSLLEGMDRPVLYRDLKAENIMYNKGMVKIVDMGCACFIDEKAPGRVGTWGYAPPEQLSAEPEDNACAQGMYSDVYAFGRLVHYMLTGDSPYMPPFEKPGIRRYDGRFDRALERLIIMCTKANPLERLPDMSCVQRELEKIKAHRALRGISGRGYMNKYIYEKNIFLR